MAPHSIFPRSAVEGLREQWLTDPSFLIAVCRRLLGVPVAPLLVAADELRMLGKCDELGERCPLAIAGLKFLAALSQHSFLEWRVPLPNTPDTATKPVYIVASAYSAIDHTDVSTMTASNRPVYHLPLPPLDLGCGWDHEIANCADDPRWGMTLVQRDEARAAGRHSLWLLLHKPRDFMKCFAQLKKTDPAE